MSIKEIYKCVVCNKDYKPWRITQKFCSKACAQTGKHGNSYKHGHAPKGSSDITYRVWASIISRIRRPHYKTYVGMYIDPRWYNFVNFLDDMGDRPSLNYSIDRINNNDGYYKENCRWATRKEQMNNVSTNKKLEYNGIIKNQEEWGREMGISGTIICKRLKRGWSVEKAISTPNMRVVK